MTVTVAEAQARLPELIARLIPGEELTLTQDGRAVARLVVEPPPPKERKLGSMAGTVLYMAPDFDAPLDDFKDYM
jgi:antitoxin (DNA-binding transcriptional repressor) of toxin-antitoxin stability system